MSILSLVALDWIDRLGGMSHVTRTEKTDPENEDDVDKKIQGHGCSKVGQTLRKK